MPLDVLLPRRLELRPWMPAAWRRALSGELVELRVPPSVRRRCLRPERLTPSEWSMKHRRMPAADAHPGPYRPEFARFSALPMDTWALPWVREIWVCGVDQAGKTNLALSCLGWSLVYAPGPVFYQMPDEASAQKIMAKKLLPMLRGTPQLARLLSSRADDTGLSGVTLRNGVAILPAWAGSVTSTATFSARYTFSDEVDKMRTVGKEADPVDRIRKRTRTARYVSKHLFISTPAGGWIYRGMRACAQVWAAAARCPSCGELVLHDEEHVAFSPGATAEAPGVVELGCPACGVAWGEADRARAYARGDWLCIKGAELRRPETVGFHLSAFPLPDVPLAEIGRTVLRARGGDLSARRDLAHAIRAVDYEETLADRREAEILALCDDRPEGVVPDAAIACVTSVADMQKRGFWFSVRAWAFGLEGESWLLRAGYVDTWNALERLFFGSEYLDARGGRHVPTIWAIDSGGGEGEREGDLSRSAEASLWAAAHPGVWLFKGVRTMSSPYRLTRHERIPGTNRPLPGAVPFYLLNSKHYKDRLAAKLMVKASDPGAWHLHSGLDAAQLAAIAADPSVRFANGLEPLARQLCAEGRDESGWWVNPKQRANHLWDCAYYELAAVDIAQVRYWQPAAEVPAAPSSASASLPANHPLNLRTRRAW